MRGRELLGVEVVGQEELGFEPLLERFPEFDRDNLGDDLAALVGLLEEGEQLSCRPCRRFPRIAGAALRRSAKPSIFFLAISISPPPTTSAVVSLR